MQGNNGAGAPVISQGNPGTQGPFVPPNTSSPERHTVSHPEAAGPSQPIAPAHAPDHNTNRTDAVPPQSPRLDSMHPRDNTGMSDSSNLSTQGHSNEDFNHPEGGINPANLLTDRLWAYHAMIKNLQQYFTEIVQVENGASKAMQKASTTVAVPFKDENQFLGKGGLQDVCIGIRESAHTRSEQHVAAARFVEETIVKNIRRLKQEVKNTIKGVKSDANLYATRVFDERRTSQEKIGQLAKAIGLYENGGSFQPDMERPHSDPYVINLGLRRQLARQVHEENIFARTLQQCQQQIQMFEKHIIGEIKQILSSFGQYQGGTASAGFSQSWAPTETALNTLHEDSEWNHFLERNGSVLFPSDLVDADPAEVKYPSKDSPFVTPLKAAHMSRRSSVLKNWKNG
ncbi:hypothetical protein BGZ54_004303, partial [Gamsiella multidivaricata]